MINGSKHKQITIKFLDFKWKPPCFHFLYESFISLKLLLSPAPWNISKELPSVSFIRFHFFSELNLFEFWSKITLPTNITSSSQWTVSVFPKMLQKSIIKPYEFNFSKIFFQGKIVAQGKLLLRGPLFCTDDPTNGPNFKMREMTVFLFEQVILYSPHTCFLKRWFLFINSSVKWQYASSLSKNVPNRRKGGFLFPTLISTR